MPDSSTPNHSEPGNSGPDTSGNPGESSESIKKKLKLKRVVIEETEIKPDHDKAYAPAPEAQPFDEPEEEEVPAEPVPLTPEQIGEVSTQEFQDDPEDLEEEEDGETDKSALSPAVRLGIIVVPATIICAVMIFLLKTLDPFGSDLGKIAPPEIPTELIAAEKAREPDLVKPEDTIEATSLGSTRTSLQDFLETLQLQPLAASASPRGVFIDSVFIPEGAALNKQMGVVFSALMIEDKQALVVVTSPDGSKLTLPATIHSR